MSKTKTSWKPGESGNPEGRPRTGEGIIKSLAAELNKNAQSDKLAQILVKRALGRKADWRLIMAVYDFFFKIYQHEENADIKDRLDAIEKRVNELCQSKRD